MAQLELLLFQPGDRVRLDQKTIFEFRSDIPDDIRPGPGRTIDTDVVLDVVDVRTRNGEQECQIELWVTKEERRTIWIRGAELVPHASA